MDSAITVYFGMADFMFGLFKKKKPQPQPKVQPPARENSGSLVKLCELHEELGGDVTELYSEFESYNPAELRFFTMSVVSVFVQSR